MLALPTLVMLVLPTIWIVDAANGPGTNFIDLPPAVAAAASGDTIIVRAGTYSAFNVSGKALTIRGAGPGTHVAGLVGSSNSGTTIGAVPAGSTFYVSGVSFTGSSFSGPPPVVSPGLSVLGASRVVVTDGTITGANSIGNAAPGLSLSGGAEVHVSRSTMHGGSAGIIGVFNVGGSGAQVGNGCTLVADGCTFIGGSGGTVGFPANGGHGLEVFTGIASLSRCNTYGGLGAGSVSGDGIRVGVGFVRVAGWIANVIQGGSGIVGTPGYALFAYQGGSIVVHGVLSILPAAPGTPLASGPVFPGPPLPYLSMTGTSTPGGELVATQPVTTTFDGMIPSAPFTCIVDLAPSFSTAFAPLALGELLVPAATPPALSGTLDALGQYSVTLIPAATAPSLVGVPFYAQFGVYDAPANQIRLSNGLIRVFQ